MEKPSILIVEDEFIVARDIRARVVRQGYGVTDVVSTGEEAVELAGRKRPDLVLMDIKLGGAMDGVEAAERIRELYGVPVVCLARFFAREVLPRVQASLPEAEFWMVGRDPVPAVWELGARSGVIITDTVRDMRPFIAQAAVIVVPLIFASGMRQNILEAWAMGKCVVSTRVGAEGLEYEASLYSAEQGAWSDLRPERDREDPSRPMKAWCHGAAGIALARLASAAIVRSDRIEEDAARAIASVASEPPTRVQNLCCGNFGRLSKRTRKSP